MYEADGRITALWSFSLSSLYISLYISMDVLQGEKKTTELHLISNSPGLGHLFLFIFRLIRLETSFFRVRWSCKSANPCNGWPPHHLQTALCSQRGHKDHRRSWCRTVNTLIFLSPGTRSCITLSTPPTPPRPRCAFGFLWCVLLYRWNPGPQCDFERWPCAGPNKRGRPVTLPSGTVSWSRLQASCGTLLTQQNQHGSQPHLPFSKANSSSCTCIMCCPAFLMSWTNPRWAESLD